MLGPPRGTARRFANRTAWHSEKQATCRRSAGAGSAARGRRATASHRPLAPVTGCRGHGAAARPATPSATARGGEERRRAANAAGCRRYPSPTDPRLRPLPVPLVIVYHAPAAKRIRVGSPTQIRPMLPEWESSATDLLPVFDPLSVSLLPAHAPARRRHTPLILMLTGRQRRRSPSPAPA